MNTIRQFRLLVDYDIDLESIVNSGHYGYIDKNITSINFPPKQSGRINVLLEFAYPKYRLSTNKAIRQINYNGCRPADLHELLALEEQFPDEHHEYFPIVGLGSVWKGRLGFRYVPVLKKTRGREKPDLFLGWRGTDWGITWCLAMVRICTY